MLTCSRDGHWVLGHLRKEGKSGQTGGWEKKKRVKRGCVRTATKTLMVHSMSSIGPVVHLATGLCPCCCVLQTPPFRNRKRSHPPSSHMHRAEKMIMRYQRTLSSAAARSSSPARHRRSILSPRVSFRACSSSSPSELISNLSCAFVPATGACQDVDMVGLASKVGVEINVENPPAGDTPPPLRGTNCLRRRGIFSMMREEWSFHRSSSMHADGGGSDVCWSSSHLWRQTKRWPKAKPRPSSRAERTSPPPSSRKRGAASTGIKPE